MKIVIAMDSFKGSMTSTEAGNAVKDGFLSADPSLNIEIVPLADGGEGTIDELLPYVGGQKSILPYRTRSEDPLIHITCSQERQPISRWPKPPGSRS